MSGAIGPHEGRELELMLAGTKQIAYFAENDPFDEFEPYVKGDILKRFVWRDKKRLFEIAGFPAEVISKMPDAIMYFRRGNENLCDQLISAISAGFFAESLQDQVKAEAEVGRILGYREEDIEAYLANIRKNFT